MAKHPRWLEATVAALGAWVLAASAISPARPARISGVMVYLPATGPPPLRFQAPHPIARLMLPPLVPRPSLPRLSADHAQTNTGAASNLTSTATDTHAPGASSTTVSVVSEPAAVTTNPLLPAMPLPSGLGTSPSAAVDPQMILEYLSPSSTNSTNHDKVLWPVFIPPNSTQPVRSSQGIYQIR